MNDNPSPCQPRVSIHAAPMSNCRTSHTISLILDFDGTLTKKDTLEIVAEAGYGRQGKSSTPLQPRPWTEIVEAYMSDFKAHVDSYVPQATRRNTVHEEIAWLDSLRPIEQASFERVIQAGVFDQVNTEDIEHAAKHAVEKGTVELRRGWADLFATIDKHNTDVPQKKRPDPPIQIVSVNWSAFFIRQTLRETIRKDRDINNEQIKSWCEGIPIYANELPSLVNQGAFMGRLPKPGVKAASDHPKVQTSADKVAILNDLRMRAQSRTDGIESGQRPIRPMYLYIGDSTTDIECLISADIGICIRDEPLTTGQRELADTCLRLGIEVLNIMDKKVFKPCERYQTLPRLLWANDFQQIRDWLESNWPYLPHLELDGRAIITKICTDSPSSELPRAAAIPET